MRRKELEKHLNYRDTDRCIICNKSVKSHSRTDLDKCIYYLEGKEERVEEE